MIGKAAAGKERPNGAGRAAPHTQQGLKDMQGQRWRGCSSLHANPQIQSIWIELYYYIVLSLSLPTKIKKKHVAVIVVIFFKKTKLEFIKNTWPGFKNVHL